MQVQLKKIKEIVFKKFIKEKRIDFVLFDNDIITKFDSLQK